MSKDTHAFKEKGVPPFLWIRANQINVDIARLTEAIEAAQKKCGEEKGGHDWQKEMWKDPKYCPGINDGGKGILSVIKEFHCPKCNARKQLQGAPWQICRLCGGNMRKVDNAHSGGAPVHTKTHASKCANCGHEYDMNLK